MQAHRTEARWGANQWPLFQVLITTLGSHTAMIWAARIPQATTTLLVRRVHRVRDQQGNWLWAPEQGENLRVCPSGGNERG